VAWRSKAGGLVFMNKQKVHTAKTLQERRRELRRNLTPAEAYLWKHLKNRQLNGRRFTKQHSIGIFIVDFYCAGEKLIVELDGEVHNNAAALDYDESGSSYFSSLGYKVIRFENKMVFENLTSVLAEISGTFL